MEAVETIRQSIDKAALLLRFYDLAALQAIAVLGEIDTPMARQAEEALRKCYDREGL